MVETRNGPIVHIPGTNFADLRVLQSSTLNLWDVHRETFDYLHRSALPEFMAITIHCHFGGRPPVIAVFDKLFKHMKHQSDVWFPTYTEIAQWVLNNRLRADPKRLVTG